MIEITRAAEPVRTHGLWIDGWRPARSGATFPTYDPATGQVLAHLARGGAEDVDDAVRAATRAGAAWAKVDPNERARLLWKLGELILHHLDELARTEALDTGKPISNARAIDIPRTADTFFYFSGWATKLHGETIPVRGPFFHYTVREPIGVIGAIIPWNFPILLAARKLAPSLAAGNAVVLKPPEEASLSCLRLGELCAEVGLPPGLVSVVTGYGHEAGAALVAHPGVGKIAFTGGTDTGKIVMASAANGLKRLQLELGGKSPNIVLADADVVQAAKAAVSAAFYNQGELCTSGSRLLVDRAIEEEVLAVLTKGTQAMVMGDPLSADTQIGPLVSAEHRDRVRGYVALGAAEGATLAVGGQAHGPGYFVRPAVFTGVRPAARLAQEEVFGPVLSVIPFDGVDEAVRIANSTAFGLAAGLWTRDLGTAHRMIGALRAGTVWVNTYNRFDAASPYGGVGQSGFGRENGAAVLDEVTTRKTVWIAVPE